MFDKIDALVSQNNDAILAIVANYGYNIGLALAIIFGIGGIALIVWYSFYYSCIKDHNLRQQLKALFVIVTSVVGTGVSFAYILIQALSHAPLRYLVEYLALRRLGLM